MTEEERCLWTELRARLDALRAERANIYRRAQVVEAWPEDGVDFYDAVYDTDPDNCWRCDACTATTEVGLCSYCQRDLQGVG